MVNMKQTVIKTALEGLYFTGMHHWMRPLVGGVGAMCGRRAKTRSSRTGCSR